MERCCKRGITPLDTLARQKMHCWYLLGYIEAVKNLVSLESKSF